MTPRGPFTGSHMLNVKNARLRAEHDVNLLKNRLERLRQEERLSAPIGVVLGACVGAINAVLAYRAEASVGESIDLLRAEGLLDD